MTLIKFESIPIKESNEPLVDLEKNGFIVEPMYYKQGLSKEKRLFLREGLTSKLQKIEKDLKPYKFKVWDAFRSREVQNNIYLKYWEELKNKHPEWDKEKLKSEVGTFVTKADDSNRIPPHSTGGAIDLTLVDEAGKEVNMGTAFDYFGPEASSMYFEKNKTGEDIRRKRKLLREAMTKYGFRSDEDEWWHFDYGNQTWAVILKKPYAIYGEASIKE